MLTVLIAGDELAARGGNFCQQRAFIAPHAPLSRPATMQWPW